MSGVHWIVACVLTMPDGSEVEPYAATYLLPAHLSPDAQRKLAGRMFDYNTAEMRNAGITVKLVIAFPYPLLDRITP